MDEDIVFSPWMYSSEARCVALFVVVHVCSRALVPHQPDIRWWLLMLFNKLLFANILMIVVIFSPVWSEAGARSMEEMSRLEMPWKSTILTKIAGSWIQKPMSSSHLLDFKTGEEKQFSSLLLGEGLDKAWRKGKNPEDREKSARESWWRTKNKLRTESHYKFPAPWFQKRNREVWTQEKRSRLPVRSVLSLCLRLQQNLNYSILAKDETSKLLFKALKSWTS